MLEVMRWGLLAIVCWGMFEIVYWFGAVHKGMLSTGGRVRRRSADPLCWHAVPSLGARRRPSLGSDGTAKRVCWPTPASAA